MSLEIPISKQYFKIGLFSFGIISLILAFGLHNGDTCVILGVLGIGFGILMPIIQLIIWSVDGDYPFHFRESED